LEAVGEYTQAESVYRDALAMKKKLYPTDKYPEGHPDLAASLNNLGALLWARGAYARAESMHRDALAMTRKLYPPEQFPKGHHHLATTLSNLGGLLQARAKYAEAAKVLSEGLAMVQDQAYLFAQAHAEGESLNFLATLPATADYFLSVTREAVRTVPT